MNNFPQVLTLSITSLILLGLGSCASTELEAESPLSPEPVEQVTETESFSASTPEPEKTTTPATVLKEAISPANTIPVTIYRVDRECSEFVAEQVTVSEDQAIEDAVAKTLEIQPGFELPLGYRVEVDSYYQIAVIDFRVPTTSRRTLSSLSACEQLALFGSLRETLTRNPDWEIYEVYFTNLGEEILF